jgi:hypothetical protein
LNASHGKKQIERITWYKTTFVEGITWYEQLKESHGIKHFEGITWYISA